MKRLILAIFCAVLPCILIGCGRDTKAELPSASMKADPNAKMDKAPAPPPLKMPDNK